MLALFCCGFLVVSLWFSLIVSGLFVWFVSILWIIDINGFNFSMRLSVLKIKKVLVNITHARVLT